MDIKDKKIGVIMTGSFCTFSKVIEQIKELVKRGADVLPDRKSSCRERV